MPLLNSLSENFKDARVFGLAILTRHLARIAGRKEISLKLKNIGKVHLRTADSDASTLRQVFRDGEYDFGGPKGLREKVRREYDEILARGQRPVVIDAGANIGAASLWFRRLYPDAAIVAIEPDPDNLAILRKNVAGDPLTHVVDAAIGSKAGHVDLEKTGAGWGTMTHRSTDGVPVVTISMLTKMIDDSKLFIVKVDIEGFESDLFADNLEWLDDAHVVMIEPHDWMLLGQRSSGTFQQALAKHPFEIFIRGENLIFVRV